MASEPRRKPPKIYKNNCKNTNLTSANILINLNSVLLNISVKVRYFVIMDIFE
jgi:hypothetical protein